MVFGEHDSFSNSVPPQNAIQQASNKMKRQDMGYNVIFPNYFSHKELIYKIKTNVP